MGVGWTAIKNANQILNLQGSVSYARQSFFVASHDENLIGSVFLEDFSQKFLGGATLRQRLVINPAWNITRAYSANASVVFAVPLDQLVAGSGNARELQRTVSRLREMQSAGYLDAPKKGR